MFKKLSKKNIMNWGLLLIMPFLAFSWMFPYLSSLTIGNDYTVYSIDWQMDLLFSIRNGTFPFFAPGFSGGQSSAAMTLAGIYNPVPYVANMLPLYWSGYALDAYTLVKLLSIGLVSCIAFSSFRAMRVSVVISFILTCYLFYNLRLLDMFRYGASLESYTGMIGVISCIFLYSINFKKYELFGVLFFSYYCITGGHPQIMYISYMIILFAWLFLPCILSGLILKDMNRGQLVREYYMPIGLTFVVSILLASPYLLSFYFDFITHNIARASRPYTWSIDLKTSWATLIASAIEPFEAGAYAAFYGGAIFLWSLIYIFFIIVIAYKKRSLMMLELKVNLFLAFVILVVLLIGLGDETPLHYLYWKYVPFANSYRVPGRIYILIPYLSVFVLLRPFSLIARNIIPWHQDVVYALKGSILFSVVILLFSIIPLGIYSDTFKAADLNNIPAYVRSVVIMISVGVLLVAYLNLVNIKFSQPLQVLIAFMLIGTMAFFLMRYGTWVGVNFHKRSYIQYVESMKNDITILSAPGFGMASKAIQLQRDEFIVSPFLSKFYVNYKHTSFDDGDIYSYLRNNSRPDLLIVDDTDSGGNLSHEEYNDSSIKLIFNSFNKYEFIVKSNQSGYFYLNFPFSINWTSFVDGDRSVIKRADGNAMGVFLTAGTHNVTFEFISIAAMFGFLIIGICISLVFLYYSRRYSLSRRLSSFIGIALFLVPSVLVYYSATHGKSLGAQYEWDSYKEAGDFYVSYGKRVSMSSYNSGGMFDNIYPSIIVDGGARGDACVKFKDDDEDRWLEIDLESFINFEKVEIYFHADEIPQVPILKIRDLDGRLKVLDSSVRARIVNNSIILEFNSVASRYLILKFDPYMHGCLSEVMVRK
jgi:hypothetical protein